VSTPPGSPQSFKIFVPREQVLDRAHLPALLKVAASKRRNVSWEGSAWRFDGRTVSPGDRLRHALLVPRLVAPHRNAGYSHEIGPEECLALIAQGRLTDVDAFARKHDSVPSWETACDSDAWLWRLVGGFAKALVEESAAVVCELAGAAAGPAERAAATVVAACALIEREDLAGALRLLDDAVDDDACDPTDHAWLLVQRSRVRADLDDQEGAASDAAAARLMLLTAPQDPTSSAIAAAAAEAVFRASDWNGGDLEDYIIASDTAVSWWRMQTLSNAYDYATDRLFDAWAQRNVRYLGTGHPAYNELLAARWNASLCANVGSWRACSSLFARQLLIDSAGQDSVAADDEDAREALRILLTSGNAYGLGQAIGRLAGLGPLEPLRRAVAAVPHGMWSSSMFQGNLQVWCSAGDLLEADAADSAIGYCLSLLRDQDSVPAAVQESLAVPWAVLDAVAGLLPAAGDGAHESVRDFLVNGSPWTSPVVTGSVVTVTGLLRSGRVLSNAGDRDRWLTAAASNAADSDIRLAMLGSIADTDERARQALTALIDGGNVDALRFFGELSSLPQEIVGTAIGRLAADVDEAVEGFVRRGGTSIGPRSMRGLCALNLAHPGTAQWAPLIKLAGTAEARASYRRQLFFDLASEREHLPDEVCAEVIPMITTAMADDRVPDTGVVWLAAALGLLTKQEETRWTVRLLAGIPQQRTHAVLLMHLLRRPEHSIALSRLLADPSADVRAAAARECTLRALHDAADDAAIETMLLAAQHSSRRVPHEVASVFATTRPSSPPGSTLVTAIVALRGHPSALVRQLADRAHPLWLEGQGEGLGYQPQTPTT